MNAINAMLARVPRYVLFLVAGIVQVSLIAAMVGDRVYILRSGTDVILKTRAVDPRDFLRGDYVVLDYDIVSVESGDLAGKPAPYGDYYMFVKLAPGSDGFHRAVSMHRDRVPLAPGEVLIRGRINRGQNCGDKTPEFCKSMRLDYGIGRYFVPQGEGREIEKARNDGKLAVVAAVTSGGRAAIKRLLIDGNPVYDEPLF